MLRRQGSAAQGAAAVAALAGERTVVAATGAHAGPRDRRCATCADCCTTSARWSPWVRCTSSRSAPARILAGDEYDRLIETFHRHVGDARRHRLGAAAPVLTVTAQWEATLAAGAARFESNVVNVAHALADFTLRESTHAGAGSAGGGCGVPGPWACRAADAETPVRFRGGHQRRTGSLPGAVSALPAADAPRSTPAPRAQRRFQCAASARLSCCCMKNDTLVNHPPAVSVPADNRPLVAPIYQSVKFSFDDTGETLRYLRGEREGFFYSRSSNPTLRQLQLLAGAAAGQGRLPADGLRRCDHRREPAVPVQAGRSRSRLRRVVWADPLHRAASAGEVRRHSYPAVHRGSRRASSGCCARCPRAWWCSRVPPIRSPRSPTSST